MANGEVKLNIGASKTYLPGFVNIDVVDWAELTLNLNTDKLPFADGSVDVIFSYHTLEHVDDVVKVLSEIHRVMRHGGRLLVGVPYVTLSEYNLVNPYHKQNFNEFSFDFFDPERLLGSASESGGVLFRKVYHEFHYVSVFSLIPPPFRTWCRRHLFNVVRKIDLGVVVMKDGQGSIEVTRAMRRDFRREFQECLRGLVPYEGVPKSHDIQQSPLRVFVRNMVRKIRFWYAG